MNTKNILFAAVAMFSFAATAEIKPVADGTPAQTVAQAAAEVYSVTNFKIGKYAYKVIALDSVLNGDVTETTILAIGEGGVGGEAGYTAAFQITPTENAALMAMKSVKTVKDQIVFTLIDMDGKPVTKAYRYDATSNSLKEANEK